MGDGTMEPDFLAQKQAQAEHEIHPLLRRRWSPRAFAPRPVDRATLYRLFEAARWAPSSRNEQPWRFVLATQDAPEDFARLLDCLVEGNRRWAHRAPVLLLGCARTVFTHNGRPNRHAWYDLGQAMAHLTFQATAEDLYVHQMAGFSQAKAREAARVPEGYDPVVMAAIGYLGRPEDLPEGLREQELAPRVRDPLEEMVYFGRWGHPLPPP